MKAEKGKAIAAVLLAAAIIVAGIAIPQMLLGAEKQRLVSNAGTVSVQELSPYISIADLAGRVGKLSDVVSRCRIEGIAGFTGIREPLDMEYSQEEAVAWASKLCQSFMAREADWTSEPIFDAEIYGYSESKFAIGSEDITADTSIEFLVSPEDNSLSLWYIRTAAGDLPCDLHIMLDAVTGIPVFIEVSDVYYDADPRVSWESVAGVYSELYSGNFRFSGGEYVSDGKDEATAYSLESDDIYMDIYTDVFYFSGVSGDFTLELQGNYKKDGTALIIFRLYA